MTKKKTIVEAVNFPCPDTTDIERKLLATAIADIDSLPSVVRIVRPSYFSEDEARAVFEVIVDRLEHHYTISAETLLPCVNREYFLNNIVCQSVQFGLTTTTDLAYTLARSYEKRIAYFRAIAILQEIDKGGECSTLRELFDSYASLVDAETPRQAVTLMTAANDLMDDLQKGNALNISTGIETIDGYLNGGWHGGTLNIIAARPSVGKTTLTMQFAQTATAQGYDVLFFSLEMSAKELAKRAMISTGKVNAMDFYIGGNIDWDKFEKAIAESITDKILVNDTALTLAEITANIARYCQQGKAKMVVIDYLGLIALAGGGSKNVVQQISEITRRLKLIAKQYDIPILLLCQLSRSSASEHRHPELYDLRDSGSIEQDADVVLMLEHSNDEGVLVENSIDVWIRKNRGGRRNFDTAIRLHGDEHYANFREDATPLPSGADWSQFNPFESAPNF